VQRSQYGALAPSLVICLCPIPVRAVLTATCLTVPAPHVVKVNVASRALDPAPNPNQAFFKGLLALPGISSKNHARLLAPQPHALRTQEIGQ